MSTDELLITRRPGILVMTLHRPDRLNALSASLVRAIGAAARDAQSQPEVRAIVLTGSGDRAFCAGADLKERRTMSEEGVRALLALYRTEFDALETSAKPVVAALNGVTLGGGLELAMLCDLRYARPHVELGLPETGLGIIPGAGGTQRLPRLIGEARAKEMILLGRRVTAQTAECWGLITRVLEADADEPLVDQVCREIAPIVTGAPIAQAAALAAIDSARDLRLEEGLRFEHACYDRCLQSRDRLEALDAFATKRKPHFRGE